MRMAVEANSGRGRNEGMAFMPFRLWHYACKLLTLPLFGGFFLGMLIIRTTAGAAIFVASLAILLTLGLVGAAMGVLMAMGRLRMRCPFCGQPGPVWGRKSEGICMDCPTCGLIWTGGRFGLRIFRERLPANSIKSGD